MAYNLSNNLLSNNNSSSTILKNPFLTNNSTVSNLTTPFNNNFSSSSSNNYGSVSGSSLSNNLVSQSNNQSGTIFRNNILTPQQNNQIFGVPSNLHNNINNNTSMAPSQLSNGNLNMNKSPFSTLSNSNQTTIGGLSTNMNTTNSYSNGFLSNGLQRQDVLSINNVQNKFPISNNHRDYKTVGTIDYLNHKDLVEQLINEKGGKETYTHHTIETKEPYLNAQKEELRAIDYKINQQTIHLNKNNSNNSNFSGLNNSNITFSNNQVNSYGTNNTPFNNISMNKPTPFTNTLNYNNNTIINNQPSGISNTFSHTNPLLLPNTLTALPVFNASPSLPILNNTTFQNSVFNSNLNSNLNQKLNPLAINNLIPNQTTVSFLNPPSNSITNQYNNLSKFRVSSFDDEKFNKLSYEDPLAIRHKFEITPDEMIKTVIEASEKIDKNREFQDVNQQKHLNMSFQNQSFKDRSKFFTNHYNNNNEFNMLKTLKNKKAKELSNNKSSINSNLMENIHFSSNPSNSLENQLRLSNTSIVKSFDLDSIISNRKLNEFNITNRQLSNNLERIDEEKSIYTSQLTINQDNRNIKLEDYLHSQSEIQPNVGLVKLQVKSKNMECNDKIIDLLVNINITGAHLKHGVIRKLIELDYISESDICSIDIITKTGQLKDKDRIIDQEYMFYMISTEDYSSIIHQRKSNNQDYNDYLINSIYFNNIPQLIIENKSLFDNKENDLNNSVSSIGEQNNLKSSNILNSDCQEPNSHNNAFNQISLKIEEFNPTDDYVPKCEKYLITPSLANLSVLDKADLRKIQNFKVENEHGIIEFLEEVDLTYVNIDEVVDIDDLVVSLYSNINVPRKYYKLNVPCRYTLFNFFPVKEAIHDKKYFNHFLDVTIKELNSKGATLIDYDLENNFRITFERDCIEPRIE